MGVIPANLTPTHLGYLKAKSGTPDNAQTLVEHTWEVIEKLANLHHLRPDLAQAVGDTRLWHRLYWACFLHDFGKAATGFQERLHNNPPENQWSRGHHRHEVLSLAFVDWVFPIGHPDRLPVICAIASHHKDADDIFSRYGAGNRIPEVEQNVQFLVSQISQTTIYDLWLWLSEYGLAWQAYHQIPTNSEIALVSTPSCSAKAIFQALDEFNEHFWRYKDHELDSVNTVRDIHYRGLLLTSDHAASAGLGDFSPLATGEKWLEKLNDLSLRDHQEAASNTSLGSAILIAPTGSGKTEAAIFWAVQQIKHRPAARLFYTLPYQASMNAMYQRLGSQLLGIASDQLSTEANTQITIQHSRALLKFYQDMMANERTLRDATKIAKRLHNRAQLHFYPIQVLSPYQLLKAAYGLKGYEALLVDYTDGLFIFDEIHAYEPKRLALIIGMIGWLSANFRARFLIMTATLPPMVKQSLKVALPDCQEIYATPELFAKSQRHTVEVHRGNLIDQLDLVLAEYQMNKAVLVCCNQIGVAQEIYQQLAAYVPERDLLQLHGRFNGRDRAHWEQQLAQAVGVGVEHKQRPFILVATQVVEVSLNVDFDTLYTDPAPLEALLQRFGRVNRGRAERTLLPVHVFEQPSNPFETTDPYKPYDAEIVQASIEVLQRLSGNPIDEAQVNEWLAQIYQGPIADHWWKEYNEAATHFRRAILDNLIPYRSAELDMLRKFYALFDGIQVLPVECEDDYYTALEHGDFLGATQYWVNLSWGQYHACRNRGLIIPKDADADEYVDHINIPYSSKTGLALYETLQQRDEDE